MSSGRTSIRERRLVQAIGLVMTTTHADRSIHRPIVLECPTDLRAPIAEALAATEQLEVHERIDATMAELGPNTERHHANLVDAPEAAIEMPEPERKEPSITHARERLIDIQNGQAKTDRPPADLRQQHPFREALEDGS